MSSHPYPRRRLLEAEGGLGQQSLDLGLEFRAQGLGLLDEAERLKEREGLELSDTLFSHGEITELEGFELGEAGDFLEIGIRQVLGVVERETAERLDILDDIDAGGGFEAFAELEVFEREAGDMLQGGRGGTRGAEFEALQFGERGESGRADIGEVGVGEAEALKVRQV